MKGEDKNSFTEFDKIWYIENNLRYAGIILKKIDEDSYRILKYADGIYSYSFIADSKQLIKRYDNISFDIYTHRLNYINGSNKW